MPLTVKSRSTQSEDKNNAAGSNSGQRARSLSATQIGTVQRTVGNQALQRAASAGQLTAGQGSGPSEAQSTETAKPADGLSTTAQPEGQADQSGNPADVILLDEASSPAAAGLKDPYAIVAAWLEGEAASMGKSDLLKVFTPMKPAQREAALQTMGGVGDFSKELVQDRLTSRMNLRLRKQMNWERFEQAVQAVQDVRLEEEGKAEEEDSGEGGRVGTLDVSGLQVPYKDIALWLNYKAHKQEQMALMRDFIALSIPQQKISIHTMAGTDQPTLQAFSEKMSTRIRLKKRVDWDAFAKAVRAAKAVKTAGDEAAEEESGSISAKVAGLDQPYKDIVIWLNYKAHNQDKVDLMKFFNAMEVEQKKEAIRIMADTDTPDLTTFTEKMSTRIRLVKRVDWDRFSTASRTVRKMKIEDRTAGSAGALAGQGTAGAGFATSVAGGASKIAAAAGDAGGLAAAAHLAPVTAGLGALGSTIGMVNAAQAHNSSLSTFDAVNNAAVGGAASAADTMRSVAQTVETGRSLSGAAAGGATATLTTMAAAGGIVSGTINLASGIAGTVKHGQRKDNLERLQDKSSGDLAAAAGIGAGTQTIERNKSAATAAKGAVMITAGVVMLTASGPIGWLLLGAAGAIAGATAIYSYFARKSRKEEVVDRYLKLDEEENQEERDKLRDMKLQQQGFNTIDQCYSHIITELSDTIYEKGVEEGDEEYAELITNIGLDIDRDKKTPTPQMIAKKLI